MGSENRVRVGVNGYGVIGKWVADTVMKQGGMRLAGVTNVATDWRPRIAVMHQIPLFGATAEAVTDIHAACRKL